jgi:hypothetical protein
MSERVLPLSSSWWWWWWWPCCWPHGAWLMKGQGRGVRANCQCALLLVLPCLVSVTLLAASSLLLLAASRENRRAGRPKTKACPCACKMWICEG